MKKEIFNQQATITFNLEESEAKKKLNMMLNVDNYQYALYEIDQFLINYSGNVSIKLDANTMEYIYEKFLQILTNNKLSEDDLL